MKRFLLPLLAALTLPSVVNAGVPEKFKNKWMVILDNESSTWQMNTEDIEIKGEIIRFLVKRYVKEADKENSRGWEGKLRINCKKYTRRAELKGGATTLGGLILGGGYTKTPWADIKEQAPNLLASNFCYLTGVEGYTAEPNPPESVKNSIKYIESKPIKKYSQQGSVNINCDSPVWKNKPRCN